MGMALEVSIVIPNSWMVFVMENPNKMGGGPLNGESP